MLYGVTGQPLTEREISVQAEQIDPQDAIKRLHDYGHFDNPDRPTGVKAADLSKLTLDDEAVRTALDSYREFMHMPFEVSSSGKLCPDALVAVMQNRCGLPDYPVEEPTLGADMSNALTGRGSWPANCHPDFPGRHTFTVQFDFRTMPSFLGRPDDPNSIFSQAWLLCRQAYADMGIMFIMQQDSRANTLVTWQRGAGWLGLAIVGNRQTCSTRIWAKYDNRYQPSQMVFQWAFLFAHEFGHNMGMSHFRGGIMNASLIRGVFTPTQWRGDTAEGRVRGYFGGTPIPFGPGPGPGPGKKFDWSGAKVA